jgi:hypothetical protein
MQSRRVELNYLSAKPESTWSWTVRISPTDQTNRIIETLCKCTPITASRTTCIFDFLDAQQKKHRIYERLTSSPSDCSCRLQRSSHVTKLILFGGGRHSIQPGFGCPIVYQKPLLSMDSPNKQKAFLHRASRLYPDFQDTHRWTSGFCSGGSP